MTEHTITFVSLNATGELMLCPEPDGSAVLLEYASGSDFAPRSIAIPAGSIRALSRALASIEPPIIALPPYDRGGRVAGGAA